MERVLQQHAEGEFENEQLTAWTSCPKDEGGPLGIGFQEQVPNQSKLLRLNGRGGERWIKSPK